MKYYIDCEFDGHRGHLLSLAMVCENGYSIHIGTDVIPKEQWVIDNVLTIIIDDHCADVDIYSKLNSVGLHIRNFLGNDSTPHIIADSPVDIGRFCKAISTDVDGEWCSTEYQHMTFEVFNVDCYPTTLEGAVKHNAWWDAMALKAKLEGEGL